MITHQKTFFHTLSWPMTVLTATRYLVSPFLNSFTSPNDPLPSVLRSVQLARSTEESLESLDSIEMKWNGACSKMEY